MELIVFRANQNNFNETLYRKTKQKQKAKCKESFVELSENYLKIQKYVGLFFRMLRTTLNSFMTEAVIV